MSRLNDLENFAGRVSYAAQVISNRRNTSRAFDNCFENCDGDAVVAARDKFLAFIAEEVVQILIDMKAPGTEWLDLAPIKEAA